MKTEGSGHYGLALTLLGMALTAFILTGRSEAADNAGPYGPFIPVPVSHTSTDDNQRVQELITRQLTAIQKRAGDEAYALTTGNLHQKYPTANQFMSMMRFSCRPVYNHSSYKFLDQARTNDGGVIQRLEVRHKNGDPTTVIYRLQRTTEGNWGIDSFSILDNDEGQDI